MCVFFPLFSLSDNKCTLCLAFVLLRVCLRTTRINCLSQNVSVDTVRKVKNESRVLVRVVQEKSRHNFEFRVLLRKP